MRRNVNNRTVAAAAAVLIVIAVLTIAAINPTLLYGLPAILWAVAEVVRAINGTSRGGHRPLPGPTSTLTGDPATDAESGKDPGEEATER